MRRVPLSSGPWLTAGALLFALFFLAVSLYISTHRMFWYDEVFTTLNIRLPDVASMWRALIVDNWDALPIGYFVLVRPFDQWFGGSEVGIRIPSALAVTAGLLLVYDIARRLSDRLHGFLAMALLTCSFLPYYSYEGRAYGILFFVAALVLWCWITGRPAWVFGLIFLAGVLIHYYAVLLIAPLAAEELYQWRVRRRPGWRVPAAIAGAAIAVAILSPQILASRKTYGGFFWARPSITKVPTIINGLFPPALVLLGIAILWILIMDQRKVVLAKPMTPGERTGWFFLLVPLAGFVLAKVVTNAFHTRYLIGILPGIAVAVASFVWRRYSEQRAVTIGLVVLAAGYGSYLHVNQAVHADQIDAFGPAQNRTNLMVNLEPALDAEGRKYIVIPDKHILFLEARYYSKHPERYVLFTDHPKQPPKYYPFTFWTADDVKQHFRESAFVEPAAWLVGQMREAGVRTVLRQLGPVPVYYME